MLQMRSEVTQNIIFFSKPKKLHLPCDNFQFIFFKDIKLLRMLNEFLSELENKRIEPEKNM
jgi:hypothetical protein